MKPEEFKPFKPTDEEVETLCKMMRFFLGGDILIGRYPDGIRFSTPKDILKATVIPWLDLVLKYIPGLITKDKTAELQDLSERILYTYIQDPYTIVKELWDEFVDIYGVEFAESGALTPEKTQAEKDAENTEILMAAFDMDKSGAPLHPEKEPEEMGWGSEETKPVEELRPDTGTYKPTGWGEIEDPA